MDMIKETLLCRLCGACLKDRKFKNIFGDATNLLKKLKETLPIHISQDDNESKQICVVCYEKVIVHYNFIQEVLEHEKVLDNAIKIKALHDIPRKQKAEIIDSVSRVQSDTIYSCPNCNVDLMILLSSNTQGCDYSFQISLAIVNCTDKLSVCEKTEQISKNLRNTMENTDTLIIEKHVTKNMEHSEGSKASTYKLDGTLNTTLQQKEDNYNKSSSLFDKENSWNRVSKPGKRKMKENDFEVTPNHNKTRKLEIVSQQTESDLLSYRYNCIDTLIKVEPMSDSVNCVSSEDDLKVLKDSTAEQSDDATKAEKYDATRTCPKIICDLCGARYMSQLKYEFHMERHKAGKTNRYVCTLCDKETSNENLLWDHYYYTHKNMRRYVCVECEKIFTRRTKVNKHQKRYKHCGVKEVQLDTDVNDVDDDNDISRTSMKRDAQGRIAVNCNLCGKLISDLDPGAINDLVTCATCEDSTLSLIIDGDEAKVISPRQYHCSKCPKHFVRKERLEFHEMRHNENMKEFICSTCGKEFVAENSLYEHYLFVHKGARPHICELCGKSFQLKTRLKEHHRTHTGERPYQCDICGQKCMTTNALRLHRKIHFSQNRYTCNICNKSFSKKQNMNEHLEKHWKHDKNVSLPNLFTCPTCSEDFPTYRMLKHHMIEVHKVDSQDPILTKQKPWYECADCHEKFKHQMSLKAHREKVHEGRVSPVYECNVCNATYRIKQLLINHIRSKHDGEKRYKCAQCGKGFNDTKSLYNHILLHTGKKPYTCEYCNASFRRKDSRDHHRRKHTGEQPYQCPDCGESFATYNSRSKHRKREHGEGELECPECGERCNGQQEIRIHLNKHLGEKLQELRYT